jgi:hypothetical protein
MKSGGDLPHTADYYLERAAECERLASEVLTEENRQILQQMAARWRGLAAEASRTKPDNG